MNKKWLGFSFLAAGFTVSVFWLVQGCGQKVPSLATMAVNPSPTVCGFQSLYTFENGPGCWQVDTGTNGASSSVSIVTLGVSHAVTDSYSVSLQAAITNTGASRDAQIEVNFVSPVNMSNKQMIMDIYIDPSLSGVYLQPFDFSPNFESSQYNSLPTGQWLPVTLVFGSSLSANPFNVTQMGIQFKGIPASGGGNIYISAVSIVSYITPTPTPITTPCVFQSLYTFTASPGCWQVDTGTNGASSSVGIVTLGISHAVTYSYSGSLQAAITNTGASRDAQIEVNFASPANMTGMQMVMVIYMDPSLSGMAVQPFDFSPGFEGKYTSISTGSWVPVTLVFGNNPANTTQMGIQFKGIPASSSGNVYIDYVSVSPVPLTPTPIPTFTPVAAYSWYFETNTGIGAGAGNWNDNGTGTQTGTTSWLSPSFNSSTGCLNVATAFSAQSQTDEIQYTPASPLNWTTLGVTGFRAQVYIDSSLDSDGYPGVQLFVASGASSAQEYSSFTTLTKGGYIAVNFNPPFTASGSDPANVKLLWFKIQTGGTGTSFGSGNIQLDNIELY